MTSPPDCWRYIGGCDPDRVEVVLRHAALGEPTWPAFYGTLLMAWLGVAVVAPDNRYGWAAVLVGLLVLVLAWWWLP